MLDVTLRNRAHGRKQGISGAFSQAYTFELTSTLAGLPLVEDVLGLPVGRFFDRAVDPSCNAFFLNAVVANASSGHAKPPWHNFWLKFIRTLRWRDTYLMIKFQMMASPE